MAVGFVTLVGFAQARGRNGRACAIWR